MIIDKEVVVIGAGPAGLSAALQAAKVGAKVLLVDENEKVGGQLFKQIHKFFGSKEHRAGIRGFCIAEDLLEQINKDKNIELWLKTEVIGMTQDKILWTRQKEKSFTIIRAEKIIIATGALEKVIHFQGWTLPGVMGAGAAQTMMNIHRVLPGKKALMIGSGNVGVIVTYQLLQAGVEVKGIVDAAQSLGGYGVHTTKVCRAGVPFFRPYTIQKVFGSSYVEGAEIIQLDERQQKIKGSEKIIEVDLICLATGFTPLSELAWMCGCKFTYIRELGGHIPLHNDSMETTISGIYVAGDISGIEEASTAMEEGRLAGCHAAWILGYLSEIEYKKAKKEINMRLDDLRSGKLDEKRKVGKKRVFEAYKEGVK